MRVLTGSAIAMYADASEREVEQVLDVKEIEADYDVYLFWYSSQSRVMGKEDDGSDEVSSVSSSSYIPTPHDTESCFFPNATEETLEQIGYSRCFRSGFFITRVSRRFDGLLRRLKAALASTERRSTRSS
ncbi:unnamed protein product [Somion occarium]|uniref:Uncharacterized protein n=1 Tax=Somion occarium TaxID=3059160 RepID=A0ABP1D125_9APHY